MTAVDALPLLIIALGALVVPLVSSKVGIPGAVGEIAFGAAVGPYALGLITPGPAVTFLSELGFAFLMFLAGLELEFSEIERQGKGRVAASLLFLDGPVPARSGPLSLLIGEGPFVFVALGAVSVGVLLASPQRDRAGPRARGPDHHPHGLVRGVLHHRRPHPGGRPVQARRGPGPLPGDGQARPHPAGGLRGHGCPAPPSSGGSPGRSSE